MLYSFQSKSKQEFGILLLMLRFLLRCGWGQYDRQYVDSVASFSQIPPIWRLKKPTYLTDFLEAVSQFLQPDPPGHQQGMGADGQGLDVLAEMRRGI